MSEGDYTDELVSPEPDLSNVTYYIEDPTWLQEVRFYAKHFIPLFCIAGIIGNAMSLILIRTNYWLRRLTSNVYLSTLSICGCLFLFTVLCAWIDANTQLSLPLYTNSNFGCKFLTFLAHASDFTCVWMICFTSIDRFLVLNRPRFRCLVSKKVANRAVACILVISSLCYGSWCLMFAGLESNEYGTYCGIIMEVSFLGTTWHMPEGMHAVFTICDAFICTVIPSIVVLLVNLQSIYRYNKCKRIYADGNYRVRFHVANNNNNNNTSAIPSERTPALEDTKTANSTKKMLSNQQSQTTNQSSSGASNIASTRRIRSSDLQLTRSLLIVTSTFVLLNVPNYIFRLVQEVWRFDNSYFHTALFLTFLLYYLHHAVLFYMYIFWSPQMKKQLFPTAMKLLECYCFKTIPEFGHSNNSVYQLNKH